ncbi:ribonuclease H-like domain-containing protein [Gymnopilus junonius]|uniref:RNA exonuclease 4 n=1 Tax=Gymnopilus junonius TaxID=109634 RepID=A0A9P5NM35_GYMJU|nr:ribonuclease H-like domain-containing protein [Gymnopilus junonius]
MSTTVKPKSKAAASSNWLNLLKQLKGEKRSFGSGSSQQNLHEEPSKKRRKLETQPHASRRREFLGLSITSESTIASSSSKISASVKTSTTQVETHAGTKNGESITTLRQLTLGQLQHTDNQKLPGKYLAIDCEMVGVGYNGGESSLARVSMVNFHGAVVLDEFVKQKERVVDYRTRWSGIRPRNMLQAKPFEEVQKIVADLIKDKILIGHAIHNDLKVLLLSHPRPYIRDTQVYAHKFGVCKSKYVALKNLVRDEIGITIQGGEHSSLTDARATMAVYRLYKSEWEQGSRPLLLPMPIPLSEETTPTTITTNSTTPSGKRKGIDGTSDSESEEEPSPAGKPSPRTILKGKFKAKGGSVQYPGGGRKGVSSGLSTVIRRKGERRVSKSKESGGQEKKAKSDWWKQLPGGGALANGSKGSVSLPGKA